ncbi:hypothetical protein HK096_006082 [Nowakowskiella sp. JEL0078]|nr:hypothetical protein HK096_006082 [Nowakowskiella sp. JEL0078]
MLSTLADNSVGSKYLRRARNITDEDSGEKISESLFTSTQLQKMNGFNPISERTVITTSVESINCNISSKTKTAGEAPTKTLIDLLSKSSENFKSPKRKNSETAFVNLTHADIELDLDD